MRVVLYPPQRKRARHPYQGFLWYQGLPVDVENVRGSIRRGKSASGQAWATLMPAHYGEIRGTRGADGDPVDVFVGEDPYAPWVYVIQSKLPTSKRFDETKCMLGFDNQAAAVRAFRQAYTTGGFFMGVTRWPVGAFIDAVSDPLHAAGRLDERTRAQYVALRKAVLPPTVWRGFRPVVDDGQRDPAEVLAELRERFELDPSGMRAFDPDHTGTPQWDKLDLENAGTQEWLRGWARRLQAGKVPPPPQGASMANPAAAKALDRLGKHDGPDPESARHATAAMLHKMHGVQIDGDGIAHLSRFDGHALKAIGDHPCIVYVGDGDYNVPVKPKPDDGLSPVQVHADVLEERDGQWVARFVDRSRPTPEPEVPAPAQRRMVVQQRSR